MNEYIALVEKLHQQYAWFVNLFYQPLIPEGVHYLEPEE
jgi:hypothetical protein